MTAAQPLLEVRSLSRSFGDVEAVQGLTFTVEPGQVRGFIGPNGAGKTTTMRIIATLDLPDAGDVFVDGFSVLVEPKKACTRLGFMADQFHAYPNLSVHEFLDFMARANGLRGKARQRAVAGVEGFCGLDGLVHRPATGLSKGMGQRLHLARTLLHDPSLLVLDEPAAGLDPRARVEFRDLVRELADAGKAILISSHLLAELAEICDGVIVIEQGKLVVAGGIDEIARDLKAHRAIRLRTHADGEVVERFLLTQPGVTTVLVTDEGITFDFEGDNVALAGLLARVVEAKIPVYDFRRVEVNLEQLFLKATQGKVQ